MKKSYLFSLLTVVILSVSSSCSDKGMSIVPEVQLQAKAVKIAADIFRPNKLFIYKNNLIVFDEGHEHLFKVFDMHSLKFRFSFGNIGQGPGEFTMVDNTSINIGDYIEILDGSKIKYYSLSDTSAILKDERSVSEFEKERPVSNLIKIDDSNYVFRNGQKNDKELCQVNFSTHHTIEFGEVPTWNDRLKTAEEKMISYLNIACRNPESGTIASFYYKYPCFKLFSSDNNLIRTVKMNVRKSDNDETIYFTEPCATKDGIYVMWVNKDKKEVEKDMENFKPNLFVFDWDGNLVNNFKLNKPVLTFTVSEGNHKVYALSWLESNVVYEYPLPQAEQTSEFKVLSTAFYSVDMFKPYKFTSDKTDNLSDYNGYRRNKLYLGKNFKEKDGKYKDLGGMDIVCYFPETAKSDINYLVNNEIKIRKQFGFYNIKTSNFNIGKDSVILVSYVSDAQDPKTKQVFHMYSNEYYFKRGNNIVEFGISTNVSASTLDKYKGDIEYIISSFQFKQKSN